MGKTSDALCAGAVAGAAAWFGYEMIAETDDKDKKDVDTKDDDIMWPQWEDLDNVIKGLEEDWNEEREMMKEKWSERKEKMEEKWDQ